MANGRQLGFFSGDEALREVAKYDGSWNWCLVGPDPEKLPLSGGGRGCIEEMKDAIGAHPMSYGLLRISFGTGKDQKTRFVFVHASDADDPSNGYSLRERGQAIAKAPAMDSAICKFAQVSCRVQITTKADCTPEFIVDRLQKVANFDADCFTVPAYKAAMEDFRDKNPVDEDEEQVQVVACKMVSERAPAHSEAPPAPEPELRRADSIESALKQRKAMKLYKKGDSVLVYSNAAHVWHDDGVIIEVIDEACKRDGFALPAGSMKAQYNNGRRYKWVTPVQAKDFLKKSTRPVPPPPLTGELFKETHNFITEWHVRHFELSKGFLQWWMTADDARNGARPNGVVSLLGLQMRVLETVFSLRTSSTKGVIYSFDATTDEGVSKWTEHLSKHAAYCEEMRNHLAQQKNETERDVIAGGEAPRAMSATPTADGVPTPAPQH